MSWKSQLTETFRELSNFQEWRTEMLSAEAAASKIWEKEIAVRQMDRYSLEAEYLRDDIEATALEIIHGRRN